MGIVNAVPAVLYFDIMKRADGRAWNELRPVKITPTPQSFAEGAALIELGRTQVLCTASLSDRVPNFLKGSGGGWITAEYAMLPRSTVTRTPRDTGGRTAGRSQEIQRLIGRSLRAVTDLAALGERTIIIDCDVLLADGGTRTAAISGAYVALHQALDKMAGLGIISKNPLKTPVGAVSTGVVGEHKMLDLCYDEDSSASADFNVVMAGTGDFIEVQGTAEGRPFNKEIMDSMLKLAEKGIREMFAAQQAALKTEE